MIFPFPSSTTISRGQGDDAPDGRAQPIDALLAKAEAAGMKPEDLDEVPSTSWAPASPPTSTTRAWTDNSAI